VGILGWIDGGSDFPTVNMGMQDAILALKWVQNNILFFGGDATRVTRITLSHQIPNLQFSENQVGDR